MHNKTIEGLIGASMNSNLMDTPMQAFHAAERKGDTATMNRAMGYAAECADTAEKYQTKAEEGMAEDAKEAKEKTALEQEELIKKRKEEKLEERIEESKNLENPIDTVELSPEGKELAEHCLEMTPIDLENTEPVTYTKTGELVLEEAAETVSVSI